MKERKKAQKKESTKERKKERTKETKNERKNERKKERTKERKNKLLTFQLGCFRQIMDLHQLSGEETTDCGFKNANSEVI